MLTDDEDILPLPLRIRVLDAVLTVLAYSFLATLGVGMALLLVEV
jgi:hypothetical protein